MSGKGQSGGGDNWNSGGNDFTGGFRNFGGNGGGWNNRSNRGWGDRNNQWGNGQSPSPEKQTIQSPQPPQPPQPQQQYQNGGLTVAQPYRPPRPNVYPPATDLGGGQSMVYTDEDQARDSARPQPTTPERKPTYSPYRNSLSQMDTNGFMSLLQQLLGGQSFNQYQTPMSGTNSLYNRYGR